MPRLVLINGLPGSGKSSLARQYAEAHPLTLVLDLDVVRGLLGAWLQEPAQSGLLARELAVAMAKAHLRGGRDVIVPQFLGRPDFVNALAALATELGAGLVEIALIVEPSEAARRFSHRTSHPLRPEDGDAAALLARLGGPSAFHDLQAQLNAVVAARPNMHRLSADGDPDSTLRAIQRVLDE
jgi:predicted kinase